MKRERRKKLSSRKWAQITSKKPVVVRWIRPPRRPTKGVCVNGYRKHSKLEDVGSEEKV
jgi:hypothetical protein